MIKFDHTELFWLFWLLPAFIIFFLYNFKVRVKERNGFASQNMLSRLIPDLSGGKTWLKNILLFFALSAMLFAIVNPQIGTRIEEVKREGVDIMIAVDVSASMMAEDIKPSRLLKAKHSINTFIDKLKGDRIGLEAFAGAAYIQCPLTLDYSAAKMFTDILDTSLIPIQGTAMAEAIQMAVGSFVGESKTQRVLIIISDGEDHEAKIEEAIKSAKEKSVTIYTVGMGSPSGAPVPGPKGYIKDKSGSVVLTRLNESLLTEVALQTGGGYYRVTPGEDELNKIYDKIFKMDKTEMSSKQFTDYEDRFQYFAERRYYC
ncbi:MAG: VWA domain-containing protein [Candidatus Marinimicrobia bacterium]|nr:VWA domain-containing protein [Candidatus Neomarinimicrobiota bacterium]